MDLSDLKLYPWIRPFVKKLIHGPTGFCVGGIKTEDPVSSGPATPFDSGKNKNDIFSIAVPFAGEILRMQIIFDGINHDIAPDILLPDYEDFDPEYDDIKSLVNWDKSNEDGLLLVVQDVMELYKEHHRACCSEIEETFASHLDELFDSDELQNIEVCLKRADKNGMRRVVNVLVQIDVDISMLSDDFFVDSPPHDVFIHSPLLLIKNDFESKKVIPLLYLPARLDYVFGGRGSLTPPPYTPGMSMLGYTRKMREKLNNTIKLLAESHGKRREYIAAFLHHFKGQVIEYDAKDFRKIVLLFSYQTFFFLIHIGLGNYYPREQPSIVFQSAYHKNQRNQPFTLNSNDYPYSPRWTGMEMAKRTKSYILEKVVTFKDNSIRQGVL